MGRRGPQPKPDWLRVLEGNPGKKTLRDIGRTPTTDTLPPPAHFNEAQRQLWNTVCSILAGVNALCTMDQLSLMRYVELLHEYRKAAHFMATQTDGNIVYPIRDKNGTVKSIRMLPQLRAMLELSNHLLRIEQHFGLTPSSRAAIMRPNGNPDLEPDPFA